MPAHAARGRRRAVAYPLTALAVVAATLLVAGPHAALSDSSVPAIPVAASPSPSTSPSTSPSASPYRVVGLGDSVPAGSVCGCTSYVSLVAHHQDPHAEVANLAQGGLTTSGLLDQLDDTSVDRTIAAADLVIITIGANDFDPGSVASCAPPGRGCFDSTLDQQKSQLDDVLKKVGDLRGNRNATVLMTGYWNVFLDGDVAADRGDDYVRTSVALTRTENAQIEAAAKAGGATYVDLFTPFKGASGTRNDTDLLASDGDHPDAAGHRAIADAVESALSHS